MSKARLPARRHKCQECGTVFVCDACTALLPQMFKRGGGGYGLAEACRLKFVCQECEQNACHQGASE